MTELVNKYETIFVLDAALSEEETTALQDKFTALIAKSGEVESVDVWGKRRLAYPINYKTEGYYVLVNFTSSPDFPKELERVYGITEGVLRTIIVRRDEEQEDKNGKQSNPGRKNGERQSDFINCVAFRNTADFISKYFHKGNMISIDGAIQTRTYDDNEGKRHYVTEVIANDAGFIESKREMEGGAAPPHAETADTLPELPTEFGADAIDDDLPF